MTKECSNDLMPKAIYDRFGVWVSSFFRHSYLALAPFGNSGLSRRTAVPEGLRENSPAFQRRETCPGSSSPEGTIDSGSSGWFFQPSLRDLWGQAVPTPIGAGTACPRSTRRNLLHSSQFLRCCDWPRRHSRAPAAVDSGSSASLFQPSLRDSGNSELVPALKRRAILILSLRDNLPRISERHCAWPVRFTFIF